MHLRENKWAHWLALRITNFFFESLSKPVENLSCLHFP
jgi:hypothetical protein